MPSQDEWLQYQLDAKEDSGMIPVAQIIGAINGAKTILTTLTAVAEGEDGYTQAEKDEIMAAAEISDDAHDDRVAQAKARLEGGG